MTKVVLALRTLGDNPPAESSAKVVKHLSRQVGRGENFSCEGSPDDGTAIFFEFSTIMVSRGRGVALIVGL